MTQANLSSFIAAVVTLQEFDCSREKYEQYAKMNGIIIDDDDSITFSADGVKYRYTSDYTRITIRATNISDAKPISYITIDRTDSAEYIFTDYLDGKEIERVYNPTTACMVEYKTEGSRWKLVDSRSHVSLVVRTDKFGEHPAVKLDDSSIPKEVKLSFSKDLHEVAYSNKCIKHLEEVLHIIIALRLNYSELFLFAVHTKRL